MLKICIILALFVNVVDSFLLQLSSVLVPVIRICHSRTAMADRPIQMAILGLPNDIVIAIIVVVIPLVS